MTLYDELDASGTVVRSRFVLGPYDILADGHTWVEHNPSLEDYKTQQKQLIESWRDEACGAPVTVVVGGVSYQFQADERSQSLLSNSLLLVNIGAAPVPSAWRTLDNQDIAVTLTDLHNIATAMATNAATAYPHSWTLKAQVDVATTVSEVQAITW